MSTVSPSNLCILEARELKKSFMFKGNLSTVLEGLNFSLGQGQFISIIGPSGCGKSTFLELLCGITKPDQGQVFFCGEEITGKTGILGYMPQDDLLFPWLNTLQNILLPVRVRGGNLQKAKQRVDELIPLFGLQNHLNHLPHQLSGGLKQRVALMRTYMSSAKVLLLDEPLAKLDALTRAQLQAWLKQIVAQLQLTVILVTHDIDEAIMLSDRIDLMSIAPGYISESIALNRNTPLNDSEHLTLKHRIQALFIDL